MKDKHFGGKLRSQSSSGQKWLLCVKKAMPGSLSLDTPYPICVDHYSVCSCTCISGLCTLSIRHLTITLCLKNLYNCALTSNGWNSLQSFLKDCLLVYNPQVGSNKIFHFWECPGGPVVRTRHSHCQGPGSIPGPGTKIPLAMRHGQKKKKIPFLS